MSEGVTATKTVTIWINGSASRVPSGSVVSAAMLAAGEPCRRSISGEPRTALCGMGICFECRAVVDGVTQQRTCQLVCREGMRVETQS
jgi:sarcosine oxidase subunit alpha